MGFDFQLLENAGIQLIDGDRGKNYPKHNDFMENGYCLFLSAKNVTKSGFQFQETAFINETKDCELKAGKLKYGDIVLTTRGTVGNVAYYDSNNPYKHIRINSGMIIIRSDSKLWNPKFLYFILTSAFLQEQIVNLISGSAVPQLPARDIKKFILPVINKNIQDKISNVISALNDKISVNIDTNQTLEQMSQTLFKSWFVDFDPVIDNALDAGNPIPEALQSRAELRQKVRNSAGFTPLSADIRALFPAEFEETESGHLPAKWIFSDLSKLIYIKHGYAFKGEYFSNKATNDILLTPGNVRIGGGFKFDKFKYYDGEIPKDYIFEKDDIFVSMTDLSKECDSLGYAARIPYQEDVRFLHNQRLGRVIIGKHASSAKEFIYQVLVSQDYRNTVLGSVTGTTVKHTSPSKILSHVIPHSINGEVEKKFDSICSSYSLSISKNNENNRILLQLRDTLLPKLISGELSLEALPDLVNQTEPA